MKFSRISAIISRYVVGSRSITKMKPPDIGHKAHDSSEGFARAANLPSSLETVLKSLRRSVNEVLGADELETIKSSISEKEASIPHLQQALDVAVARQQQLSSLLLNCERTKAALEATDVPLRSSDHSDRVGLLVGSKDKLERELYEVTQEENELRRSLMQSKDTLDELRIERYHEELLVMERSRTFSAYVTITSIAVAVAAFASRLWSARSQEVFMEEVRHTCSALELELENQRQIESEVRKDFSLRMDEHKEILQQLQLLLSTQSSPTPTPTPSPTATPTPSPSPHLAVAHAEESSKDLHVEGIDGAAATNLCWIGFVALLVAGARSR